MKKIFFGILVLSGLLFSFSCFAEITPIPVTFQKAGGGQYIYCNNPEYVGEEDLSTIENEKATYMMKCEELKPDTYSVFFCFYNWTDFDVEPDIEFKTDSEAEIQINSIAYCLPTGDEFWDCIGCWADFMNMNIRTLNGYQQYVPYQNKNLPQIITLKEGESDWTGRFAYNYQPVPPKVTFLMLVNFTVLSGEADANFAALKHYGTVGDRSRHNPDALPGVYRQDTSIKGIESESLPMVEADLNVAITPEIKNGTTLPIRIFNQYYNDGNTTTQWMTNINPNRDEYLYSKGVAVGSDMLSFRFKDDSKLTYYGEDVPESKKNNTWIFDIYHHDITSYQEGMPWKKEEHVPNAYTGTKMDIEHLPNLEWELNLGNFGVTNRYHLKIQNIDNQPRILNYFLETSRSSNIVIVRDKEGTMLNPYTLKKENPFALCKGINQVKVNSCMFSTEVFPGETQEYILDVILPTNCYGGMVHSLTVDSKKLLMPVSGTEFSQHLEEFPLKNIFFNGSEYMRWENETLYRLVGMTWQPISLPEKTKTLFQHRSQNFEIVKTKSGYAARFCGWDGGLDWCIANNPSQNKIYFFDRNFRLLSEFQSDSYIYELGAVEDTVYYRADQIYEIKDGTTAQPSDKNKSFPQSNGIFTLTRTKGQLSLSEQNKDWKISYEIPRIPGNVQSTKNLFYYKKSWKTYFSDLETENILSVSQDGLYWTDFTLPNTFLELKNVYYLNGKIYVDGRFQTVVLDYNPKQPIRVFLNGEALGFDVLPETKHDRTMIPARFLFEKLNAQVTWIEETEEIFITGQGHEILLKIGESGAWVDGEEKQLDAPPYLSDNRTMIPLRFLTENLGYQVSWEEERQLVTIETKAQSES